mgnify:FL=1
MSTPWLFYIQINPKQRMWVRNGLIETLILWMFLVKWLRRNPQISSQTSDWKTPHPRPQGLYWVKMWFNHYLVLKICFTTEKNDDFHIKCIYAYKISASSPFVRELTTWKHPKQRESVICLGIQMQLDGRTITFATICKLSLKNFIGVVCSCVYRQDNPE